MSSNSHTSPNKENHMESLQEIFRCFICMENLRDARMCPRCSKLCCNPCIRRWLSETRPQCPHCRSCLHIHDLVNCRWAEEVTQQLDSLHLQQCQTPPRQTSAATLLDGDAETEKCSTHLKEELSVYCETCKCCICHECALWSPAHTNHVFKPLDEIYVQHCQHIKEHVVRLRRKFMELIGAVQDMEKNIDNIRTAKDQKVREIRNAVELMIARLDSQLKTKLMALVSQKGAVSRKAEEVEALMRQIESHLSNGPKSDVIQHSEKLLTTIQEAISESTFTIPPVPADFQSELVPHYDSANFVIKNYSQLRAKAEPFYSDPLKANGFTWRLKIYPDGNGVVRGTYLSVFLELSSGPADSAKYEYRIEMVYQLVNDPTKNMMREFASDFEINECWGYNRFFRIDLLESEGYLDPVTDTIKLRFDVRSPTYFLKCKDQQWFINQLQDSNSQQSIQIAELSTRIAALENDLSMPNDVSNLDVTTDEPGFATVNACDKKRVHTIQLLDLNDNQDTEENVSEPGSDISELESDLNGIDNDNGDENYPEEDANSGGAYLDVDDVHFIEPLENINTYSNIMGNQFNGSTIGGNYMALLDELQFEATPLQNTTLLAQVPEASPQPELPVPGSKAEGETKK